MRIYGYSDDLLEIDGEVSIIVGNHPEHSNDDFQKCTASGGAEIPIDYLGKHGYLIFTQIGGPIQFEVKPRFNASGFWSFGASLIDEDAHESDFPQIMIFKSGESRNSMELCVQEDVEEYEWMVGIVYSNEPDTW